MTFQRENRYIVIKRKDMEAAISKGAISDSLAQVLDIVCENLPLRECLVIESDWPEYEPAWRMIQARVEGATLSPAHIEDGEEVEVVGYANPADYGAYRFWVCAQQRASVTDPIMTVAQHQRIVAGLRTEVSCANSRLHEVAVACATAEQERDAALSALPAAVDRDAIHLAFEHKLREVNLRSYGEHRGDWRRLSREETADVVIELLKSMSAAPPAAGVPEECHECKGSGEVYGVSGDGPWSCYACSSNQEPVCYANFGELDNMLNDRTATVSPIKNGWYGVALYRAAPTPPASEQQRAVVMPEKQVEYVGDRDHKQWASGANWMLREFLRLNPHLATPPQENDR